LESSVDRAGWEAKFAEPILLAGGSKLATPGDAALYIATLPKADQEIGAWQTAVLAYRRRATAIPNKNATSSDPRGASRAMLLRMLNGMPGFLPASMASPIRWAVPLTAPETSSIVDFGCGAGSRPS
jgi:hypothetical protein